MVQGIQSIQNIFCVGRNYAKHAKELGNDVPSRPMIFSKPTHALHGPEGELRLPPDIGEVHYEVELVIRAGQAYDPSKSLEEMIDGVTLGIDLTARTIQSELKKKGHPWLLAKGFKGSAIMGTFLPFKGAEHFNSIQFELVKNGKVVQHGTPKHMIFSLDTLVRYIGEHFGLDRGDVIYTGTPEGVGPLTSGDVLEMKMTDPKNDQVFTLGPLNIVSS
ncbi:MAG: fumarylacetoacetate hydrolase family protein [Bacillaceae bacterium]|nr:fumarylacetoacetate hydrolase family protein [Bacillaceae bacterium]